MDDEVKIKSIKKRFTTAMVSLGFVLAAISAFGFMWSGIANKTHTKDVAEYTQVNKKYQAVKLEKSVPLKKDRKDSLQIDENVKTDSEKIASALRVATTFSDKTSYEHARKKALQTITNKDFEETFSKDAIHLSGDDIDPDMIHFKNLAVTVLPMDDGYYAAVTYAAYGDTMSDNGDVTTQVFTVKNVDGKYHAEVNTDMRPNGSIVSVSQFVGE